MQFTNGHPIDLGLKTAQVSYSLYISRVTRAFYMISCPLHSVYCVLTLGCRIPSRVACLLNTNICPVDRSSRPCSIFIYILHYDFSQETSTATFFFLLKHVNYRFHTFILLIGPDTKRGWRTGGMTAFWILRVVF